MNDRFKLRAINMETKEITYIDNYYWFEENGVSEIDSNNTASGTFAEYWINQSTGLKDKKGKLIYEGDILGGTYADGYISYCDKCKSLQYFIPNFNCLSCEGDVHWAELVEEDGNLEVIGNIYENPELLEG